jgi:hypothetical protein
MDAIAVDGSHFDDSGECRLSGDRSIGHDEAGLGSVGVMKRTRVVFAEPRVLEGVRAVDFLCIREEEPKVPEGFSRDKLELGNGVWIGSGASKVGDQWWDGDWVRSLR